MIELILFQISIFIFKFIPFWVLYRFSDVLAFLNYYLWGYRKKIIRQNMQTAFPEKSINEINKLIYDFYIHFFDILFETTKGYSLKQEKLAKRIEIENLEFTLKLFEENKNIIFVSGHGGNWEWASYVSPYYFKHKINVLYKPLTNKYVDKYIIKHRQKNNTHLISMYESSKAFIGNEKPYAVVLLADQRSIPHDKGVKVNFLNRTTYFQPGAEIFSKKYNAVVVFWWLERVKRGYYKTKLIPYTFEPQKTQREEITKAYINFLELKIKENPQNWLWSHNRWKYLKEI